MALNTKSSVAPPRKPAVPLQRGDSDTEERRPRSLSCCECGPGAPSRLGDPRSSEGAGVGTQAPPSWEGGSSAQINCSKCVTGVMCVGRKALSRWGHTREGAGDSHQEVREGLMRG